MRQTPLLIPMVLLLSPPLLAAQGESLSAGNFAEFLARYEAALAPVDEAYTDLVSENLPLRDETGQPLGRRHIEDRRQSVSSLRETAHQLAANPESLVLTTTLLVKTESLADDLFDLSQVAYDNDREELGKHLADLDISIERENELIEAYALKLAAEKQDRIQELEKQNRDLQGKLKGAGEPQKSKPPAKP